MLSITSLSNLGPNFVTTLEDNLDARFPAFSKSSPLFIPYKNAPAKVSPAPTVSIAWTGWGLILIFCELVIIEDPSFPLVITTVSDNFKSIEQHLSKSLSPFQYCVNLLFLLHQKNKKTIKYHGIQSNFIEEFKWSGKVGCGFPGVVKKNKVFSAANISKKWVGVNIKKKFSQNFNLECKAVNDADAAGIAEIYLNKNVPKKGTVMVITVGTGLGTSIFVDGKLVPNIEFGHLKMYGD